ncbi:hypothetical protein KSP40_PGU002005 [Platanthera guangdongensis]|uniref:Bifunctional inhibitor/plant lipid transfer protein/seed storage helical domain-containing protein n=1 Tax=Platanthera guangdongensis TaxID=2320717 RepID=A0ABR2N149_9ASPA
MAALGGAGLFFTVSLLFFTMAATCGTCPPTIPTPRLPEPEKCPRDAVKLGVCADVLGLVNLNIGKPPAEPCCVLLDGLVNLEAAACLCTALKANVLGIIHLDIPINLSLLLNYCGKDVPSGFQCF